MNTSGMYKLFIVLSMFCSIHAKESHDESEEYLFIYIYRLGDNCKSANDSDSYIEVRPDKLAMEPSVAKFYPSRIRNDIDYHVFTENNASYIIAKTLEIPERFNVTFHCGGAEFAQSKDFQPRSSNDFIYRPTNSTETDVRISMCKNNHTLSNPEKDGNCSLFYTLSRITNFDKAMVKPHFYLLLKLTFYSPSGKRPFHLIVDYTSFTLILPKAYNETEYMLVYPIYSNGNLTFGDYQHQFKAEPTSQVEKLETEKLGTFDYNITSLEFEIIKPKEGDKNQTSQFMIITILPKTNTYDDVAIDFIFRDSNLTWFQTERPCSTGIVRELSRIHILKCDFYIPEEEYMQQQVVDITVRGFESYLLKGDRYSIKNMSTHNISRIFDSSVEGEVVVETDYSSFVFYFFNPMDLAYDIANLTVECTDNCTTSVDFAIVEGSNSLFEYRKLFLTSDQKNTSIKNVPTNSSVVFRNTEKTEFVRLDKKNESSRETLHLGSTTLQIKITLGRWRTQETTITSSPISSETTPKNGSNTSNGTLITPSEENSGGSFTQSKYYPLYVVLIVVFTVGGFIAIAYGIYVVIRKNKE